MGKHNLKFVKPLTSVMLGVAVLTSTIAVQPDTVDAASSSNYKVSKGNLVSKTTGKIVKGTKTYKGKVYKNGKLLNGLKAGVFYKKGKKATGTYKGKYYSKGKVFTGLKAGVYYKAGAKATGNYQGKYYSKGKVFTGLKGGVYYKNGVTGTGMYQGDYYSEGSLFSGVNDGVYYERGSKATGVYNGNYYENGNLFTGLQINTGYLYINGVLNTGLRLFNGNLYKGAILNDGVIQYDGKWYKGSSLASGTITTPDGKTITVDGGIEKPSSGSGSGGGYQSPLSIAINHAINALGALSYSKTNPIDSQSKFADAKSQYDTADKAVKEAFNKGAVKENFGSIFSKLEAQKDEINRYEKVIDDEKQYAINAEAAAKVSKLIEALNDELESYKAEVKAAREAFDSLTKTQKGLVTNIGSLVEAEQAIAEAEKTEEDEAKALLVSGLIAALDEESETYKAEVDAARTAYNALTDTQKALVGDISKLEAAEQALEDAVAAENVSNQITALNDDSTEEEINQARTAYDTLTGVQKELVTNLAKLEAAENALKDKKQEALDNEKAQEVIDLITGLNQNLTEASLGTALAAYLDLSPTQKGLVTNSDTLLKANKAFEDSLVIAKREVGNAKTKQTIKLAQDLVDRLLKGVTKDGLQVKLNLAKAILDSSSLSGPEYSYGNITKLVSIIGNFGSDVKWKFKGDFINPTNEKYKQEVKDKDTLEAIITNNGETVSVKYTAKEEWIWGIYLEISFNKNNN